MNEEEMINEPEGVEGEGAEVEAEADAQEQA